MSLKVTEKAEDRVYHHMAQYTVLSKKRKKWDRMIEWVEI